MNATNINANLLEAKYAVRGAIVQAAAAREKSGKDVVYCNIGNPQKLGQMPITFMRQVGRGGS